MGREVEVGLMQKRARPKVFIAVQQAVYSGRRSPNKPPSQIPVVNLLQSAWYQTDLVDKSLR